MSDLLRLPLDQVEANEVALRTVDTEDPDVKRMFDSIASKGVLTPIRVRPTYMSDGRTPKTTADGRNVYQLIDGLHRYTGAVQTKQESIPCIVVSVADAQVEEEQLEANLHRIPTKPHEYGKHLKAILARNPTQTKLELANRLNVSEDFVDKRLSLNALHADAQDENGNPTSSIGKLVDSGKIGIANAVQLARLKPSSEQDAYLQDAMTDSPDVFAKKVKDRISELRKAKLEARDPNEVTVYRHEPKLRQKAEIEAEAHAPSVIASLVKAAGITDPTAVAQFVLKWALCLDEQSYNTKKAAWDADQKRRAEEKAAAKAEREAAKAAGATA